MIETKRLRIYTASRDAMETLIDSQTSDEMKKAYTEMLEGCLKYPEQWVWRAVWMIELKDGTHIGDLSFKGIDSDGAVEIGYGVLREFEGQGYATEAVSAVVQWADMQPEVTRIEAETETGNFASQRVLEKCGFIAAGEIGTEGPRYQWSR